MARAGGLCGPAAPQDAALGARREAKRRWAEAEEPNATQPGAAAHGLTEAELEQAVAAYKRARSDGGGAGPGT